ncbi:hypothetical protein PUN28_006043 [Cardiocondyla obscurior]|uniref:Uncharacterized protein n=1 Tax=Cardiocondyla obscurior TaxID=286306 RepID=A0AAW2G7F2_9HYME
MILPSSSQPRERGREKEKKREKKTRPTRKKGTKRIASFVCESSARKVKVASKRVGLPEHKHFRRHSDPEWSNPTGGERKRGGVGEVRREAPRRRDRRSEQRRGNRRVDSPPSLLPLSSSSWSWSCSREEEVAEEEARRMQEEAAEVTVKQKEEAAETTGKVAQEMPIHSPFRAPRRRCCRRVAHSSLGNHYRSTTAPSSMLPARVLDEGRH